MKNETLEGCSNIRLVVFGRFFSGPPKGSIQRKFFEVIESFWEVKNAIK